VQRMFSKEFSQGSPPRQTLLVNRPVKRAGGWGVPVQLPARAGGCCWGCLPSSFSLSCTHRNRSCVLPVPLLHYFLSPSAAAISECLVCCGQHCSGCWGACPPPSLPLTEPAVASVSVWQQPSKVCSRQARQRAGVFHGAVVLNNTSCFGFCGGSCFASCAAAGLLGLLAGLLGQEP
jgi:hypothetical protein